MFKTPSRLRWGKWGLCKLGEYESGPGSNADSTRYGSDQMRKTMIKDDKTDTKLGSEEHLPSRQTFLLRFSDATRPESGVYHGRVEHLGTGKTVRFSSFPEIMEFAGEVMTLEASGIEEIN